MEVPFKSRTEILSIPGALFDGIEDIMRSILTTAYGIQMKLLAQRVLSWNKVISVECYVAFSQ